MSAQTRTAWTTYRQPESDRDRLLRLLFDESPTPTSRYKGGDDR